MAVYNRQYYHNLGKLAHGLRKQLRPSGIKRVHN